MKSINFVCVLIILCLTILSCDNTDDRNLTNAGRGSFNATVINQSGNDLTDVSINGRGYPGMYGVLVSKGNATMSYNLGGHIDEQIEVVWRNADGLHTKTVTRPRDFGQDREFELVIEFISNDDVRAYTKLAPWAKKRKK